VVYKARDPELRKALDKLRETLGGGGGSEAPRPAPPPGPSGSER